MPARQFTALGRSMLGVILFIASQISLAQTPLSYDTIDNPSTRRTCVQTFEAKSASPGYQVRYLNGFEQVTSSSACGADTTGNNIQLTSTAWSEVSPRAWSPASQLPCNKHYIAYQTWNSSTSPYLYSALKDCGGNGYNNTSHGQMTDAAWVTTRTAPWSGIPTDLLLYDPANPARQNGYKFTATFAIPEISEAASYNAASVGFARVALVVNLVAGSDPDDVTKNLFFEYDVYDNVNVTQCPTQPGWIVCLVRGQTTVFERYKYWGSNVSVPTTAWETRTIDTDDIVQTLAKWRPDLCQQQLRIRQVYVVFEVNGSSPSAPAFGQLQTAMLKLEAK